MESNIAWEAVASALLEACDKAATVLDRSSRFVLANRAFESLFGAERERLLGRSWLELCVLDQDFGVMNELLASIIEGSSRDWEGVIRTIDGRSIHVGLSLSRVGEGDTALVFLQVTRWLWLRAAAPPDFERDHHYEISATAPEFGKIRSFWSAGASAFGDSYTGHRCYEVLYGRTSPCESCPAERAHREGVPLTVARGDENSEDGRFRLITARPTGRGSVEISVRELDGSMISPLMQARVEAFARQSGLSAREYSVLELLLMGRSPDEIAKALEIAPRTAKFHQTNLLSKLGADSRHDLLRILV